MMPNSAMEFWTFWAAMLGIISFAQNLLPKEYTNLFHHYVRRALHYVTPYVYFDIPEFFGAGGNEIYDYVQSYLSSTTAISAQHVNLCRPKNATQNIFSLAHNETIEEVYKGAKLSWTHEVSARSTPTYPGRGDTPNDEKRKYTLKIRKADKSRMLDSYVQHVMDIAKGVKEKSRDRLLYTNSKYGHYNVRAWESVPFKHPSTFDTLAMDPVLKGEIMADLLKFTKGKDFYERAGKAWKRGYLLFGPPGTGKSSMIAAIANFLQYDVYDVELTEVSSNAALRKMLIQTTNRSVIVIEDIDCSADLAERAKAREKAADDKGAVRAEATGVTLSGLLNFTDGLWSCCGSERIIIFTTNYIDKLDKALLRAGRMDKHIHMSWCGYPAFRTLAKSNLSLEWHDLFPEVEKAIADKAISPADVSELLLSKNEDPTAALEGLIETLHKTVSASDMPILKVDMDEDQTSETQEESPSSDDSGTSSPRTHVPDVTVDSAAKVDAPPEHHSTANVVSAGTNIVPTVQSPTTNELLKNVDSSAKVGIKEPMIS